MRNLGASFFVEVLSLAMGRGGCPEAPSGLRLDVSGCSYEATQLAPEDEWIGKLDHESFKASVRAIGKTLADQQA